MDRIPAFGKTVKLFLLAPIACLCLLLIGVDAPAVQPAPLKGRKPPAASRMRPPQPARFHAWDGLWRHVWTKTNMVYNISSAPTIKNNRACQGDMKAAIGGTVESYIRAVRERKYGDAVRHMGEFQDRTLCLTKEGARGVDFALGAFIYLAATDLPPSEARTAVQGAFNLGVLAFDQVQYTKRSWWLVAMYQGRSRLRPLLSGYPDNDLGLWLYDFEGGRLVQSKGPGARAGLLTAFDKPSQFEKYPCTAYDISMKNFSCLGQGGPSGSLPGGGGSGGGSGPGGLPSLSSSRASCVIAMGQSSGMRGTLSCMNKAISGVRPSLPGDIASLKDLSASVRDPRCALMDENNGNGGGDKKPPPADEEPSFLDQLFKWPEGGSGGGSDGGGSGGNNKGPRKPSLREIEEKFGPQRKPGDYRTVNEDGSAGTGGCGNRSNAAAAASALYNCMAGAEKPQKTMSDGPIRRPVSPSDPVDPNPEDGKLSGQAADFLSCVQQGGMAVRDGLVDKKCAQMRCADGPCSCNPANTAGIAGEAPRKNNCEKALTEDGNCPDGLPGGKNPPVPVSTGGTVGNPPGGIGPAPGPVGPQPGPPPRSRGGSPLNWGAMPR